MDPRLQRTLMLIGGAALSAVALYVSDPASSLCLAAGATLLGWAGFKRPGQ